MEGVKVHYKRSSKNRVPGTLKIMERMLIFKPDDPKSNSKLELQFQNITSKKYSIEGRKPPLFNLTNKQGRNHLFEFENYPKMNDFRDFINKAIAEFELRVKLLRENSELQRLHKQLVESKILKENEFWSTRKRLRSKYSIGKWKQQAGFKNMMVSCIKPSTDGKSNSVTYNLTPGIIFQIFAERPAVRQAFIDFVPSKMTEKDFWTKYVRAEYLYSTKNTAVAAAEAAEDEVLAIFLKPDEIMAPENRQKIRRVDDPAIDLVADEADDYTHNIDVVKPQNNKFGRSLLQDPNRRSVVIVEGKRNIDVDQLGNSRSIAEALTRVSKAYGETSKDADEERLERLMSHVAAEMEDFQASKNNYQLLPLSIKEPRDYFECQDLNESRGAGASKRNVHEAYRSLKESISEIRTRRISDPLIKPQLFFEVFSELTRTISAAKNINPRESRSLPKSTKDEILLHWTFIQELLKHFWFSYPTTINLHTKVGKLKDAMSIAYSQLEAMKESVPSDLRHEVSLLVRSIHKTLDAVFQHYEADLQRTDSSCV